MGIELHNVWILGREIPVEPDISPYEKSKRKGRIYKIIQTKIESQDKIAKEISAEPKFSPFKLITEPILCTECHLMLNIKN